MQGLYYASFITPIGALFAPPLSMKQERYTHLAVRVALSFAAMYFQQQEIDQMMNLLGR